VPHAWRPMPLIRIPAAFDHPDWVFELNCTLVSRRRHVYRQFPQLQTEIAHSVRTMSAVLDGEIVCLANDGRSMFNRLLFRRDWPYFVAFDVLSIEGEDLTGRPLLERKRRLRAIMPRIESRLVYLDHVVGRGTELFAAACARDLEGVVAKWKRGLYHTDGLTTSWFKVKNPRLLADHRPTRSVRDKAKSRTNACQNRGPVLRPELAAVSAVVNARL
jgi:bifunctional non-homologous end joining protein LigD